MLYSPSLHFEYIAAPVNAALTVGYRYKSAPQFASFYSAEVGIDGARDLFKPKMTNGTPLWSLGLNGQAHAAVLCRIWDRVASEVNSSYFMSPSHTSADYKNVILNILCDYQNQIAGVFFNNKMNTPCAVILCFLLVPVTVLAGMISPQL